MAKLAEQAGFGGIWGSGFELSASYAVPDANILSMSTHLEMMRTIASTVSIPSIADIDTGFGNAVNVHYVVPQYEAARRVGHRDGGQDLSQGHQPEDRWPAGAGPHRGVPGQDRGGDRCAPTRTSW